MTWNEFFKRFNSPIFTIQVILDVIAPAVIALWPNPVAQVVIGSLTILYNIFAGANNPTTRDKF